MTPTAPAAARAAVPLTFDTTGYEPFADGVWFDPRDRIRDVLVLSSHEALPINGVWLGQLPLLRRELSRRQHATGGSLIEADAVQLGGVPALYTLVRQRLPKSETGMLFRASFLLAKRTRTVVLRGQFEEWDISGIRESLVHIRRGIPMGEKTPHPYAPELPYNESDDAAWDFLLPEHPLTKARSWVRRVLETARVDPGFAAQPDA